MKTIADVQQIAAYAFISKLFEARQQAHVSHLKTTSFAAHKALDEFYSGILDLADDFVETFQGQYGLVERYAGLSVDPNADMIAYLDNLVKILRGLNEIIPAQDSHLLNIRDEILGLTYKTIYKLKFLK